MTPYVPYVGLIGRKIEKGVYRLNGLSLFEMKSQPFQGAFSRGRMARLRGEGLKANPYQGSDVAARAYSDLWERGWEAADDFVKFHGEVIRDR